MAIEITCGCGAFRWAPSEDEDREQPIQDLEVEAVWSSDRLARSLQHLIEVLQTIRDTGAGLYIHTQALDTTTPAGRAMFGMLAVFGETRQRRDC